MSKTRTDLVIVCLDQEELGLLLCALVYATHDGRVDLRAKYMALWKRCDVLRKVLC